MQVKQQLNLNVVIVGLVACALTLALIAFAMPILTTSAQAIPASSPALSNTVTAATVQTSTVNGFKVLRIGEDIYPDVIDPQKASFVNEIEALNFAYEGLTTIDANGQVQDGAADIVDLSADGLTMTFHIREGLKRADGTPLTAKDFEYALRRAVDPKVEGKQYVSLLFDVVGAQELAELTPDAPQATIDAAFAKYGVKAVDNSNLQITFTSPSAYWLYIASMPITYPVDPKLVAKDPENWWKDPANHNGNGPFKFASISGTETLSDTTELTPTEKITFVANTNYWRGAPKLDRVEISYTSDNEATLKAYEEGKLDINASMVAELVPTVVSNTKVAGDFLRYPAAQTYALAFNNTREPFGDRNVRIAFSQALDRNGFIKDVLGGVGKAYTRWIPPDVPGNQASEPGVPDTDVSGAQHTLINNGYGKDGKVDCAKLGEIKFTYPDSPVNKRRVEYISANLEKAIGCKIIADPVAGTEFTSLTKDVRTNPQLSLQRWIQDYPHPQNWLSTYWECGAFSRRYGYCNLFLDNILRTADATEDQQVALKLYELGEDLLIQDVPGAFFYNPENLQLVKPYLIGPQNNLSSQDGGWAGMFGPIWEYDVDLNTVPASYPKE